MPEARRHIPFLDGWRGLAIGLVLFSHFVAGAEMGADYGRLGVDVFFVLSGMLMSDLLFRKRVALGTFYRRRISRIVPGFALFVVVVYAAFALSGTVLDPVAVLSTFVFLRTYVPVHPDIFHAGFPISHLWSLNVEEHCYLLMGAATLIVKDRRLAAGMLLAAGIAALGCGLFYARSTASAPPEYALRSEVASSFVLLSAGYALVKDRWASAVPSWAPLVAFGAACGCYYWRAPWFAAAFLSPVLLGFAVNHLDRAPAGVLRVLSGRVIRQLGLWSFSLYLWQQPWHVFKDHFAGGVALVCAVLSGVASFYLVEQPARAWLNANWRGKRDEAPRLLDAS